MATVGTSTDLLAQNIAEIRASSPNLEALARRNGIAKSTFRTLLKGIKNCRLSTLDMLAKASGMPAWMLIHPDANSAAPHRDALEDLIETYLMTSDLGRQTIVNAVVAAKALKGVKVPVSA